MGFDSFLNGALLEDGEEEITLVGKYFCPLNFLAVRGFVVSYLYSQSSHYSQKVFLGGGVARLPNPSIAIWRGKRILGIATTYSATLASSVLKPPVISSTCLTHIVDTTRRRPRSLMLVHSRTRETMAAQTVFGPLFETGFELLDG